VLQLDLTEFGGYAYLCKLGKEYVNTSVCKFVVYFLQHSKNFDALHVSLSLTIAELSTLKQVRFFWPTLHSVLLVLTRGRHYLALATPYRLDIANFPYPLSFSTFIRGDRLQIYGKALRFLKLESSKQPMVKIW